MCHRVRCLRFCGYCRVTYCFLTHANLSLHKVQIHLWSKFPKVEFQLQLQLPLLIISRFSTDPLIYPHASHFQPWTCIPEHCIHVYLSCLPSDGPLAADLQLSQLSMCNAVRLIFLSVLRTNAFFPDPLKKFFKGCQLPTGSVLDFLAWHLSLPTLTFRRQLPGQCPAWRRYSINGGSSYILELQLDSALCRADIQKIIPVRWTLLGRIHDSLNYITIGFLDFFSNSLVLRLIFLRVFLNQRLGW